MAESFKDKSIRFFGFDQNRPHNDLPPYPDTEPYAETEPTIREFIEEYRPTWRSTASYFFNLFPFLGWIGKYNWTWFMGDLIAGESYPICSTLLNSSDTHF